MCVVYSFQCDLCDGGYVGYTRVRLPNRVKTHKQQSSAVTKYYKNVHGTMSKEPLKRFECRDKFHSLVYEKLFYKSFKAKSQRAFRENSGKSIFIIFTPFYANSSRQNSIKCRILHDLIFLY